MLELPKQITFASEKSSVSVYEPHSLSFCVCPNMGMLEGGLEHSVKNIMPLKKLLFKGDSGDVVDKEKLDYLG